MDGVAEHHQDAKRIIVIWDNLNIHHGGTQVRLTAFGHAPSASCIRHNHLNTNGVIQARTHLEAKHQSRPQAATESGVRPSGERAPLPRPCASEPAQTLDHTTGETDASRGQLLLDPAYPLQLTMLTKNHS